VKGSIGGDSMRALVLHAVGDVRLETISRPECREGHVLVRVGFCGVCGSDIPRVFTKGTYSFPRVCGHEFAGTIEQTGPGVDDFSAGDRVAVFPLIWCGRCAACEEGRYVQCSDYDYLGSRSDGAFAEYVVAPRENLVPVPSGVSLEEAAMTEPAAVALHAVKRAGGTSPGEVVVVLGAGPIGLMVAQWARALGASRILVFDIVPRKLDLAKRLGFEDVFHSREEDPVAVTEDATGGQGAHVCIEAAGVPPTLIQALTAARRSGRVVLLGNPSADASLPAPLLSRLMRREVNLYGTWNSRYSACGNDDDWRASLEAMARGTLSLEPLITHRLGLDEAFDGLVVMRDQTEFVSKVLIEPGKPAAES
jgi:L-iditol 2-dehydrogenase